MPVRIKVTDRIQEQLKKWSHEGKLFKSRKDLEEQFDKALADWESSDTRKQAEELLSDQGRLEHFLQNIEQKLARLPFGGDKFSAIPGMISMIRSYANREYTQLPKGAILAAIGALIYFFSPIDALPDFILGPGLLDDAFVITACLKLIKMDVSKFRKWQAERIEPRE